MDIVINLLSVVSHGTHDPYHNGDGQDNAGKDIVYKAGREKGGGKENC